ncbi:conjugal transfer protein TrbD [uncultured Stenotrophomonas sp.]|uniref:conjugal transfer protein TrbD n=1 Tax=uncultured Stenotrophomonas sp. TaxID=165438 RepID=UPI0025DDEB3B|nr:conjugal transfer protein TrbD [uncultured Stenotrophomonas sp.]
MVDDEPLETARIYYALLRPQEIFGGERELMLFSMLMAGTLIFSGLNLVSAIVGGVMWAACWTFLRAMAKKDPIMSKVYIQQLKYKPYYPAHSTPFAE